MRLTDLPEKYREQAKNKYIEQCEHAPKITLRSEEQKTFEDRMDEVNPVPDGALRIYVMGKPKGKGRPRFNTKTGKAYTPDSTRKYESEIKKAWEKKYPLVTPFECALRVKILAAFEPPKGTSKKKISELIGKPYTKKPDADNIEKAVWDSLSGVAWKDDNIIASNSTRKIYDKISYVVVEVSKL